MRWTYPSRVGRLTFLLVLSVPSLAIAGGYAIPPQTAKAAGLAVAVTAGVDDPSAVYANPAALTEVEGNQVMGGTVYINVVSSVENSGTKSINRRDDNFISTLFANYHIPETGLTLGMGLYTPFGLATSYDKTAFTRFAAIRSELKTLYATPTIAWRVNPYLSLGAGVSFVHSSVLLSRAVFLPLFGEGKLRITGTDDAYAYNLGIVFKPHEQLKFGWTYRSRVDLNFDEAHVKFTDPGGAITHSRAHGVQLPLPPFISMGLNWQIDPVWAVEFVYDFTRWSELEHLKARFNPTLLGGAITGFFIPQDWKDTSTLRLGSSYRLNENWEFRGGMALDETPIPGRTLGPSIPGADWLTLSAGVGYHWGSLNLDFGYMAVFYKTRKVTNDVLEGDPALTPGRDKYRTFQNLVSLHLSYSF